MNLVLKPSLGVLLQLLLFFAAAIAQTPELIVQSGHSNSVTSIDFCPNGRLLASGSDDNSIKIWDVTTGHLLRSLTEPVFNASTRAVGTIDKVAFSPDGRLLASSHSSFIVKLWDVETGRELRRLNGAEQAIAFSPDGLWLAVTMKDKTLLWDVNSGQLRPSPLVQDRGFNVTYSPNGRFLVLSGLGEVTLWDTVTGRKLRTFETAAPPIAFTPNGRVLATAMAGEQEGPSIVADEIRILLWDVATGRLIREVARGGHSHVISSLAFTPDGSVLATASKDRTISLWSMASGRRLSTLKGHAGEVYSIAFSPDGKVLASAGQDKDILMWDTASGLRKKTVLAHASDLISDIAFSPDGRVIALAANKTINLWDVMTGDRPQKILGHTGRIQEVVFSPDNRFLASGPGSGDAYGTEDKTTLISDVATGNTLRSLTGFSEWTETLGFTSNNRFLALMGLDKGAPADTGIAIRFFDINTGSNIHTLNGVSTTCTISPDGKLIAYARFMKSKQPGKDWDSTLVFWDTATRRELRSMPVEAFTSDSIRFSPDRRLLALMSMDRSTRLVDVETGRILHRMAHQRGDTNFAFSTNGRTLAIGGFSQTVQLWDTTTGRQLKTLTGHTSAVSSIAFRSDGKTLVTASEDGSLRLWDTTSGATLVTLLRMNDGDDWLAITPDGLFDGSPAAWKQILWRFSSSLNDVAPVEIFFNEFYYPGLISDIVAGKRPKATKDIAKRDRRQPQVRLSLKGSQSSATRINTRTATVRIDVADGSAGAHDLRVFRNGSLVKVWRGDVLSARSGVTIEAPIQLVSGENRLTAYAFNRDNVKSRDATLILNGGERLRRKGTAYVLAVGVNSYSNPEYNLKFAVADARVFGEEWRRQQQKLGRYSRTEVIYLFDKEATKAKMLQSLTRLATIVQPEDVVVIYFSGHGTAHESQFYLIPHDLGYQGNRQRLDRSGLQIVLQHSVSDRELEEALQKIDAGQVILVIDACNSGQVLEAEEKRRGPMNSKGLAQLAYEKGMYILTAAQSYQAALEAAVLGHGYLTYVLVEEGLKQNKADKDPKDGQVSMREWLNHATQRVPQMQREMMNESLRVRGLSISFVEGEEKIAEPEKRSVQRPRVFYRRELEAQPLIVAKP